MSEGAGSPGNHPEQEEHESKTPDNGVNNEITGYMPVTVLTDVGGIPVTSWDEMERVYRNTFHSDLPSHPDTAPPPLEPVGESSESGDKSGGVTNEATERVMEMYFVPTSALDQPVWMRRIVTEPEFLKQADALGMTEEEHGEYRVDTADFAHFACVRFHPEAETWDGMYVQHTEENRGAFLTRCAADIHSETDFDATMYRTFATFGEAGEFMSNSQIVRPTFFYGIFCGRRTGVFTDPLVVTRLTFRYPEARVRRFESSEAAQLYATNGIWGVRSNHVDPHPYMTRRFWRAVKDAGRGNTGGIAAQSSNTGGNTGSNTVSNAAQSGKNKKGKASGIESTTITGLGLPTDPFLYTVTDVHHNAKGVVSYVVTPNLPIETARKNVCYKGGLKVGRAMDHQATLRLVRAVFNTVGESQGDRRYHVPAAVPRMVVFTTDEQYNAAKKVVADALDTARDLCVGLMKVTHPIDLFPIARSATIDDLAAQGAELPALHTEVTRRGLAR